VFVYDVLTVCPAHRAGAVAACARVRTAAKSSVQ
jgi:hypothetical protein